MTEERASRDLVVLAACKNGEFAMRGILSRPRSLEIRPVTADYFVHPWRDPGVLHGAHEFLRFHMRAHEHALVLLDREGCGREQAGREELEESIEKALRGTGWRRAAAVVVDPELEAWVWSDSPHVEEELGWRDRPPGLRTWLEEHAERFLNPNQSKPARPKEAVEAALRESRRPRSSAMYRALAEKVSLNRCTDPAFGKLKETLRQWFPVGPTSTP